MDNEILTMYKNYFTLLENVGTARKAIRNSLIVLDFLNDVSKTPDIALYLEPNDIKYVEKYLSCFNNCLNP